MVILDFLIIFYSPENNSTYKMKFYATISKKGKIKYHNIEFFYKIYSIYTLLFKSVVSIYK